MIRKLHSNSWSLLWVQSYRLIKGGEYFSTKYNACWLMLHLPSQCSNLKFPTVPRLSVLLNRSKGYVLHELLDYIWCSFEDSQKVCGTAVMLTGTSRGHLKPRMTEVYINLVHKNCALSSAFLIAKKIAIETPMLQVTLQKLFNPVVRFHMKKTCSLLESQSFQVRHDHEDCLDWSTTNLFDRLIIYMVPCKIICSNPTVIWSYKLNQWNFYRSIWPLESHSLIWCILATHCEMQVPFPLLSQLAFMYY